jgi:hypothetical protein
MIEPCPTDGQMARAEREQGRHVARTGDRKGGIDIMLHPPEFVLATLAAERHRQFLVDAHDARQRDQIRGPETTEAIFTIAARDRAVTGAALIRSLRLGRWQPRLRTLGES